MRSSPSNYSPCFPTVLAWWSPIRAVPLSMPRFLHHGPSLRRWLSCQFILRMVANQTLLATYINGSGYSFLGFPRPTIFAYFPFPLYFFPSFTLFLPLRQSIQSEGTLLFGLSLSLSLVRNSQQLFFALISCSVRVEKSRGEQREQRASERRWEIDYAVLPVKSDLGKRKETSNVSARRLSGRSRAW